MTSWADIKRQMKADIMANAPRARVGDDGEVVLEVPDEFHEILDDFKRTAKRRSRRNEAMLYGALVALVALGFALNALFPQWHVLDNVRLLYIPVIIVGMAFATSNDRLRKEADAYCGHLEESYLQEARERYEAGQYHSISEDGYIDFDGTAPGGCELLRPQADGAKTDCSSTADGEPCAGASLRFPDDGIVADRQFEHDAGTSAIWDELLLAEAPSNCEGEAG